MRRILATVTLLAGCASPAFAQPTLEQLAAKVDTLSAVLGNHAKNIPCEQLEAERPASWFGDGGYETRYRLKQIGCAIDNAVLIVSGFAARIDGLAQRVAAVEGGTAPTAPPPSGGFALPLTSLATAVRDLRDLNAERAGGHIVPFNAAALRREATVHTGDHAFSGKVAVGADHVLDVDANLQVGAGSGEIVFHSRVPFAETQEFRLGGPAVDRTRLGVVSFNSYDNGVRLIRGAVWRNGIMQHNPDDPIVQVLGMDSQGTVSKSVEDYSKGTVERSQLWIIQEDFAARKIRVIPTRAGWGVEVCAGETTTNHRAEQLGHADKFLNRCVPLINALPGSQ